jgi:transcriptional regulator with XRE-family HTH domain
MSTKQASDIDGQVAERIRVQRMLQGLTQLQLGNKIGVTFQQIQKYEKGINRIGAGRLFEVARVFNIPIQALFPEPGEPADWQLHHKIEPKEVADLSLSADTLRLCRAFLQIKDADQRVKIIALVEEMKEP